jgi:hypothetical protein
MDFDQTRLYYTHQQLHHQDLHHSNSNNNNNNNGEEADADLSEEQAKRNERVIHDDEDAQIPVASMRRHFREFFRTYLYDYTTTTAAAAAGRNI